VKLVQVATEALNRLLAIPEGEEVCFSLTAPKGEAQP
jgi:hypothetical protein